MIKKDKKDEKLNIKEINEVVILSKRILKVLFAIIILAIITLVFTIFSDLKIFNILLNILKVLSPFFIGLVLAWLLDPIVTTLEKKKVKRSIGAAFVFFILIVIIYLFFRIIIPMLYSQINDFINVIPSLFVSIKEFVENIFNSMNKTGMNLSNVEEKLYESIENLSTSLTTNFPKTFINTVSTTISGIGSFSLGLIVGFYLLIDFNSLKKLIVFVPKKSRIGFKNICQKLNTTFRDYLQGTLTIAIIVFIISSIAFAIIGLPSPMLFGLVIGITNIIPYIGPWIGGAIAILVALTVSPVVAILTTISVIVIQQIDNLGLNPIIMSKAVKLHPVTIVVGLLVFEYLFGVWGLILATPIISGLKIVLSYYNEKYDIINKIKDNSEKNVL